MSRGNDCARPTASPTRAPDAAAGLAPSTAWSYRVSVNRHRRVAVAALVPSLLAVAVSGCMLIPRPVETRLPPAAGTAVPAPTSGSTPTPEAAPTPTVVTPTPSEDDVLTCGGEPVTITGQERQVRLEGTCTSVDVSGTALIVDATAASMQTLTVSGERIRVDVAAVDRITVQGNDAAIAAASSVSDVEVSGDRAMITSTGDISAVVVRGQDNTIRADGNVSSVTLEGRGNSIG